jgi:carbon storage regulator
MAEWIGHFTGAAAMDTEVHAASFHPWRREMLVLSRRCGETIYIGDEICVSVMRVQGDEVRLGIVAPRDVPVHRSEVWRAIKEQKAK